MNRCRWSTTALLVAALMTACSSPEPAPEAGETTTSSPSTPTKTATTGAAPPTAVSDDDRTLVTADGSPAIWVADTAWFLTERLTRDEIAHYLDTRAAQGFTTIQMVAVAGLDGTFGTTANIAGDAPFEGDFSALLVTDGSDPSDDQAYDYWDHVDFAVQAAHRRGFTVALLPAWSRAHAGVTLHAKDARSYGRFLAERYRDVPLIWVMGGDDVEPHTDIWRELAAGIREVDEDGLFTYHPAGWHTSLGRIDDADFAMVQTSHCDGVKDGYTPLLEQTIAKDPGMPIVDAEPLYEHHPWCWEPEQGYSTPEQTRAHQWWSLFAGGFGVTYGHHSVWQFHGPDGLPAITAPQPTWQEALHAPVAEQMRHLRTFIEALPSSRPVPAAALIVDGAQEGWDRALALRSDDASWAAVYLPSPRPVTLDGDALPGTYAAHWFDPRTGERSEVGTLEGEFTLQPHGEADMVLVLQRR